MKTLLRTVALTAVALCCFNTQTQAREADFVYQVWACEMPTHAIYVYKPGYRYTDSYHFSEADAEERASYLEARGMNVTVAELDGPPSKKYVVDNSVFVKEFDDEEAAQDFADIMMDKTGLFCWVKQVEVYPWGP